MRPLGRKTTQETPDNSDGNIKLIYTMEERIHNNWAGTFELSTPCDRDANITTSIAINSMAYRTPQTTSRPESPKKPQVRVSIRNPLYLVCRCILFFSGGGGELDLTHRHSIQRCPSPCLRCACGFDVNLRRCGCFRESGRP